MTIRALLVFTFLLLALTATTLWMTQGDARNTPPSVQNQAQIGGAFTLTDQRGQTVKDMDFRGRLMLVYFGFTNCPDQCPLALGTITQALEKLGGDSAQVAPIFITVDPTRDTPERLKEYLGNFSPMLIGLTGTDAQIAAATKTYKAYYSAPVLQHDEHGHADHAEHAYNVDHSGFFYLMGRDGAYLTHFSADITAEQLSTAIKTYLH